ncbi:MAG: glycosyltransferase family 39 protein, partial [Planctomycetaceae bacterium]
LDPTGTFDRLPDGPGLTIDESLNVQQGVRLEIGLRYLALGVVDLREVFGASDALGTYMADYPPLGRWLLGVSHNLVTAFARPDGWDSPFVYAAGRFASAVAFAVTVFFIGGFTRRRYGVVAGLTAAAGLVMMPRVFGHAHIASLETLIGLFFTATVLSVAERWRAAERIPARAALCAGFLLGLALLTKIQAVLLPIPIALWALWHWRGRAIVPLAVFGATGGFVFFLGWPWLWLDPVDHLIEYLGRSTDRISLPVWYLGRVFPDKEAPWHYPFVMFAVTVPVGLQALGAIGIFAGHPDREGPPGWRDPAVRLLLAYLIFPLLVFAVPGVAVYDGARLFLVSFPLWAVLIGRGGGVAWNWLRTKSSSRVATIVLMYFLVGQAYGIVTDRPTYLSYYNLLVGGLAGAERLGFEPTYWGDSITSELLDAAAEAVPEGGTLAVSPVLHQFQLDDLRTQSPALRRRNIRLVEYDTPAANNADAVLVFERRASLPDELRRRLAVADPIAIVERQGVRLAGVYP